VGRAAGSTPGGQRSVVRYRAWPAYDRAIQAVREGVSSAASGAALWGTGVSTKLTRPTVPDRGGRRGSGCSRRRRAQRFVCREPGPISPARSNPGPIKAAAGDEGVVRRLCGGRTSGSSSRRAGSRCSLTPLDPRQHESAACDRRRSLSPLATVDRRPAGSRRTAVPGSTAPSIPRAQSRWAGCSEGHPRTQPR